MSPGPPLPRPGTNQLEPPSAPSQLPFLLVLAAAVSCGPPPRGNEAASAEEPAIADDLPPIESGRLFTEVTLAAGIRHRHRLPTEELTNIVDSLGGGAAFADLDGDGWLDLLLLGGARSPYPANGATGPGADRAAHGGLHLYRNLRDGRFEEVGAAAGLPSDATAVAVAIADVDGDGDRDVYLVDRGPDRLYLGRGDGTFEDATSRAGLGSEGYGAGAVFLDLERDGDLDLYVTHYLEFDPGESDYYAPTGFPGPLAYPAQPDVLYRNRGDGRFEDVSAEAGIAGLAGRGMSLASGDFDDDGDTDLFVANDATENFLLLNDGRGRFEERGLAAGVALGDNGERTSAMAADVGDVDGDGLLDLAVSDTAFGALYCRGERGVYRERSRRAGLPALCGQYVTWGQNLIDFDDDGDLDLFMTNGGLHHLVGWEDLLLANDGAGRYEDVSTCAGPWFARREVGRCSAVGDYDNDGDLDVVVTNLNGRPALLRNDRPEANAWITLDLVGARGRDPFGARVRLEADGGVRHAELRCPTGYLGQSDPRLHFGLGPGVERVERVTITWPDGAVQEVRDLPARRIHRIERNAG